MTSAEAVQGATRILVIDDDDDFRRSTARILALHGYSSLEASTSVEARAVLDAEQDVAAALCDVRMPGTSGIELLAELAVDFPDLAVVMTTGVDDPAVAEEAFALGAFGYVTKPFEANELLINLACALRRRDLESARRHYVHELESSIAQHTAVATTPLSDDAGKRIRILIVDEDETFADRLAQLLGSRPEFEVAGTADSVSSALADALAFKPDVVLMDFELPDGDGPNATERLKTLMPSVHVIMLTDHTAEEALVRAIAAGCSGFVEKEEAEDHLIETIVSAYEGEPAVASGELAPLLRQLHPTKRGLGADLTPRELEVLRLMASGLVNKQVAKHLGLRLNTVRNHSQNVLHKLQAHSRLEAVAIAVRDGLISYPTEPVDN